MADQATVRRVADAGNGVKINAPAESVVGNVTEFAHDITTLAELQAKLALVDLKEAVGRAIVPAASTGVGLALMLASLPVALLGAADLLVSAGMSQGLARLLTAALGLVVAGALAFLGYRGVVRSLDSLTRSRDELARNVSWIKTVLKYSGRAMPRRRP